MKMTVFYQILSDFIVILVVYLENSFKAKGLITLFFVQFICTVDIISVHNINICSFKIHWQENFQLF